MLPTGAFSFWAAFYIYIMHTMASTNDDELIYRQGIRMAELINKNREKEPLTEVEQRELENWLNSNIANKTLFESLHNREQLSAEVKALLHYDENAAVATIFKELNERPPSIVRRKKMMMRRWSVAASILGIVGVASWFFIQRNTPLQPVEETLPIAYKTITATPGSQKHLALSDGSEVWLNATSSIHYPPDFKGDTRKVTIEGEAYFKVAKDKAKPFVVTAGDMKVEVTGTEFNVMAYADEDTIRTTLVEGSVKVGGHVLKPGEQAAMARASGTVHIEKPNLNEVTGWRNNQFSFHETNMEAIMRQVARWYNVKIEYRGSVTGIGFTGDISRKEHVQDVLDILADTRKVHFELKNNNTVVVIPGPR